MEEGRKEGSSETNLALDDHVGNAFLSAEGWQPQHELNGVNVVGNDDELGLLLLNEGGDVVKTELNDLGLLGVSGGSGTSSGLGEEALLLGSLGLGGVLLEEGEESLGCKGKGSNERNVKE